MHHDPDAFEERALDIDEILEHAERYQVRSHGDVLNIREPEDPGVDDPLVSLDQVVRLIVRKLDDGSTLSIGGAR